MLEKLLESKTSKSSKLTAFQSCVTILPATPVGPNVSSSPRQLEHKKVSSILPSMLLVSKSLRIATEDASQETPFLSVVLVDLWKETQNKCAMQCNLQEMCGHKIPSCLLDMSTQFKIWVSVPLLMARILPCKL